MTEQNHEWTRYAISLPEDDYDEDDEIDDRIARAARRRRAHTNRGSSLFGTQ